MHHDRSDDELREAPLLRMLKGTAEGLPAPEGFHERFPGEVMAAVAGARRTTTVRRLAPWAALAAAAAVAAIWILGPAPDMDLQPTGAETSPDPIDAWMAYVEDLWGMDHQVIAEAAPVLGTNLVPGPGITEEEFAAYIEYAEHRIDLYTQLP
jgi:hypothetical protein